MAKVTGPLFSMSASGTIGDAVTYGSWMGIPWARVWFKPQNPQTAKQVNVRDALIIALAYWKALPEAEQEKWNVIASGTGMSGYNKMMKNGLKAYALDPGVEVPPTSCTYTGEPGVEVWAWNAV